MHQGWMTSDEWESGKGRRTLMEMWHDKHKFRDTTHWEQELKRFINFYNTVKPHVGLKGLTPFEVLEAYFYQPNA